MSMIKDQLEPDKIWRIVNITMYDRNAEQLLKREFVDTPVHISTELISNFIQTLEDFAKNQFQEHVYEIHLGNYRVLFEEIHGYILVALVLPGDAVDTGKTSPMSRAVRTLLQRMGEVLNLETADRIYLENADLQFVDNMVDTINSTADNPDSVFHNIQNFEDTARYFVTSVIITDNLGKSFISRSYEEGVYSDDPLLLSSLLSAINSFAGIITELKFKEIVLGKYRLYLENYSDRIYVTTIELENEDVVLNHKSEVTKKVEELNKTIIDATNFLDDGSGTKDRIEINHHTLTAVVDSIVIKTLQNTLGMKEIDRDKIGEVDVFDQKGTVKQSKSRASGQKERITDGESYEKAKSIFGRIKSFFTRI